MRPLDSSRDSARARASRLARVEKVYLYWATKDRAGLTWFRKHLSDFASHTGMSPAQVRKHIHSFGDLPRYFTKMQVCRSSGMVLEAPSDFVGHTGMSRAGVRIGHVHPEMFVNSMVLFIEKTSVSVLWGFGKPLLHHSPRNRPPLGPNHFDHREIFSEHEPFVGKVR